MQVNTFELIEILKNLSPKGLEVTISNGILRATKSVYLRGNSIYLFGNELRYEFNESNSIHCNKFEKEYDFILWSIEQEIF